MPKTKYTKYCSKICCVKENRQKILHKRKYEPEFAEKHRKNERERKKRKKIREPEYKIKRAIAEKKRYRAKNNIKSDDDLKVAPRGSGTITKHGYKIIKKKDHPNAWKGGAIFEHVFVMSEHLQRPLKKGETVHHKNGIRNDNRIENLELWSKAHPPGQRIEDKIKWCKEFLEQYGYDVIMKKNSL